MFSHWFSALNRFQSRFTYRQKFIFFSLVFWLATPLPAYWLVKTQNYVIQQVERQLIGNEYQKILMPLLSNVIKQKILQSATENGQEKKWQENDQGLLQKSITTKLALLNKMSSSIVLPPNRSLGPGFSTPNATPLNTLPMIDLWSRITEDTMKNDKVMNLYDQLINEIKNQLILLGDDYELFLSLEGIQVALMKINLIQLPQAKILLGDLFFLINSTQINENIIEAPTLVTMNLLKHNEEVTKEEFEGYYNSKAPDEPLLKDGRDNLINYNKSLTTFLNIAAKKIKSSEHAFQLQDEVFKIIENADKIWKSNLEASTSFLNNQLRSMQHQKYFGLIVLGSVMLLIIFSAVFHALSIHMVELCRHIQEMAKGDFKKCFCSDAKDEFGPVGRAFDQMGNSIQGIVSELDKLGKHLTGLTNQIVSAAKEQEETIVGQENNIKEIEKIAAWIAKDSRELANSMNELSSKAKQDSVADGARSALEHMQQKMTLLSTASNRILESLLKIQNKMQGAHTIIDFLTKVSDKAKLLHLNSAIEATGGRVVMQDFNKTTDEIERFADKTFSTTQEIRGIINNMLQSVKTVRSEAYICIKDINTGAKKLISVSQQLTQIAKQGREQVDKFENINDVMQIQALAAENIIESISGLTQTAEENTKSMHNLHETTTELERAAEQLQVVIRSFFNKQNSM